METWWHLKLQGQKRSLFVWLIMNYVVDVLLLCMFFIDARKESGVNFLYVYKYDPLNIMFVTGDIAVYDELFWYLISIYDRRTRYETKRCAIIHFNTRVCQMQIVNNQCPAVIRGLIYLHGGRHDHISVNNPITLRERKNKINRKIEIL